MIYDKATEQYFIKLKGVSEMRLIIWRKDRNAWQTDYPINGKRRRTIIKGFTKSEKSQARAFALELYQQDIRGVLYSECKTTFKDMTETYYAHRGAIRDKGKKYRMNILLQFIGDTKLDKIGYQEYEAIKRYLKQDRKIKNQSINHYLNDLGAVMNLAKKQRVIKDFPPIINLQKEAEREKRALEIEEIKIIRKHIQDYLRDPFEFTLSTGWRRANIVKLTKQHLTRKRDGLFKVNIPASEFKLGKDFEHHCTKLETDIINRNISLEHKYIFRRNKKLNGADDNGLGDFKKAEQTLRKKCGFYWTWHWLRHTRSTNYGYAGYTEAQMNSLMGWSPQSRMAGNYTHMKNKDLTELRQETEDLRHHNDTKTKIEDNG